MGRAVASLALVLGAAACSDGATRRTTATEETPLTAPSGAQPAPDAASQPSAATAPRPVAARAEERLAMVRDQIEARGVASASVLAAMRAVPRHEFVPEDLSDGAYDDGPLPIGHGQTISQPYIVASMTEELDLAPGERALEIGTGSGYQAAVLAEITDRVHTIEIVKPLADDARERLARLGYGKVQTRQGDGWFGWKDAGPFDAIVVTAATAQVPPPLVEQLAPGGRMVVPVGQPYSVQTLVVVTKDADGTVRTKSLYGVRFVPFARSAAEEMRAK